MMPFAPATLNVTSKLEAISWDGVNYLVEAFNRLMVKNEGNERKFVLGVRWDGFAKESDTDEPLESIYMHVPRMVRDYIAKQTLSPDERREVERQMDALDNISGGNCPNTNTDEPDRAMNVYGSEMRDAHRDEMSEAWTLPGDTS